MLYALTLGKTPHESFAWGLAAASASCMTFEGAKFDQWEACRLFERIKWAEKA